MSTTWDLYSELVKTSFKLRYRGSVLGFLWVLMKPFIMFLILFLVFSKLGTSENRLSSGEYAVYLLTGLIVFNFFNEGIIWGMRSIMDRFNLILKINFNRRIAVVSYITMAIINLLINLFILSTVSIFIGIRPSLTSLLYSLFIIFILHSVIYSISLFSSIVLVHLRDLDHITELAMQLLFYGSAIFYPISMVPEKWRFLLHYNPIAIAIDSIREALLFDTIVHYRFNLIILLVSIAGIIVGSKFFNKNIKRIAEFY